jgi:hypothetical protein
MAYWFWKIIPFTLRQYLFRCYCGIVVNDFCEYYALLVSIRIIFRFELNYCCCCRHLRLCTFYQCVQTGELISHLGRHQLSCSQVPYKFHHNCRLTCVWVHTFRRAIFFFALGLDKRSIVDSLVTLNSSSKLRKLLCWMYHTRTIRPLICKQLDHITFGLVCRFLYQIPYRGTLPHWNAFLWTLFLWIWNMRFYTLCHIYIYSSKFNFLLTLLFHCRLDKHCLRVYDYHIWWLGSLRWPFLCTAAVPRVHLLSFQGFISHCLLFMSALSAFCTCTSSWCWFSLLVD